MDAYEMLGTIGEGTYGVVLRARHKESKQVVAIKKFKESDEDEQVRKTALREVRILKMLRHDNIVSLIEVFRRKRKLYLVFEYVERTLLEELERQGGGDHGLEPEAARRIMWQVVRSVDYLHSHNVIHRDIKPENLLLSKSGVVKLCDFGFARPLAGHGARYTDYVSTRWYRCPELLIGDTAYSKPVDVWAIGCLFAELATGVPLFPGDSDIDQLFHIMRGCGSLAARQLDICRKNPLFRGVSVPDTVQATEAVGPRLLSVGVDPLLVDMITRCLSYEPLQRITTSDMLRHPYLESMEASFADDFRVALARDAAANILGQRRQRASAGQSLTGGGGSDGRLMTPAQHRVAEAEGQLNGAAERSAVAAAAVVAAQRTLIDAKVAAVEEHISTVMCAVATTATAAAAAVAAAAAAVALPLLVSSKLRISTEEGTFAALPAASQHDHTLGEVSAIEEFAAEGVLAGCDSEHALSPASSLCAASTVGALTPPSRRLDRAIPNSGKHAKSRNKSRETSASLPAATSPVPTSVVGREGDAEGGAAAVAVAAAVAPVQPSTSHTALAPKLALSPVAAHLVAAATTASGRLGVAAHSVAHAPTAAPDPHAAPARDDVTRQPGGPHLRTSPLAKGTASGMQPLLQAHCIPERHPQHQARSGTGAAGGELQEDRPGMAETASAAEHRNDDFGAGAALERSDNGAPDNVVGADRTTTHTPSPAATGGDRPALPGQQRVDAVIHPATAASDPGATRSGPGGLIAAPGDGGGAAPAATAAGAAPSIVTAAAKGAARTVPDTRGQGTESQAHGGGGNAAAAATASRPSGTVAGAQPLSTGVPATRAPGAAAKQQQQQQGPALGPPVLTSNGTVAASAAAGAVRKQPGAGPVARRQSIAISNSNSGAINSTGMGDAPHALAPHVSSSLTTTTTRQGLATEKGPSSTAAAASVGPAVQSKGAGPTSLGQESFAGSSLGKTAPAGQQQQAKQPQQGSHSMSSTAAAPPERQQWAVAAMTLSPTAMATASSTACATGGPRTGPSLSTLNAPVAVQTRGGAATPTIAKRDKSRDKPVKPATLQEQQQQQQQQQLHHQPQMHLHQQAQPQRSMRRGSIQGIRVEASGTMGSVLADPSTAVTAAPTAGSMGAHGTLHATNTNTTATTTTSTSQQQRAFRDSVGSMTAREAAAAAAVAAAMASTGNSTADFAIGAGVDYSADPVEAAYRSSDSSHRQHTSVSPQGQQLGGAPHGPSLGDLGVYDSLRVELASRLRDRERERDRDRWRGEMHGVGLPLPSTGSMSGAGGGPLTEYGSLTSRGLSMGSGYDSVVSGGGGGGPVSMSNAPAYVPVALLQQQLQLQQLQIQQQQQQQQYYGYTGVGGGNGVDLAGRAYATQQRLLAAAAGGQQPVPSLQQLTAAANAAAAASTSAISNALAGGGQPGSSWERAPQNMVPPPSSHGLPQQSYAHYASSMGLGLAVTHVQQQQQQQQQQQPFPSSRLPGGGAAASSQSAQLLQQQSYNGAYSLLPPGTPLSAQQQGARGGLATQLHLAHAGGNGGGGGGGGGVAGGAAGPAHLGTGGGGHAPHIRYATPVYGAGGKGPGGPRSSHGGNGHAPSAYLPLPSAAALLRGATGVGSNGVSSFGLSGLAVSRR